MKRALKKILIDHKLSTSSINKEVPKLQINRNLEYGSLLHSIEANEITEGENVFLNVYHVSKANKLLEYIGLGFYHSAIEVYSFEFAYGENSIPDLSGITKTPKEIAKEPYFHYKETIYLGKTSYTLNDIIEITKFIGNIWTGTTYCPFTKNCNHFSERFSNILLLSSKTAEQTQKLDFPSYINRFKYLSCCFLSFFKPIQTISYRKQNKARKLKEELQAKSSNQMIKININNWSSKLEEVPPIKFSINGAGKMRQQMLDSNIHLNSEVKKTQQAGEMLLINSFNPEDKQHGTKVSTSKNQNFTNAITEMIETLCLIENKINSITTSYANLTGCFCMKQVEACSEIDSEENKNCYFHQDSIDLRSKVNSIIDLLTTYKSKLKGLLDALPKEKGVNPQVEISHFLDSFLSLIKTLNAKEDLSKPLVSIVKVNLKKLYNSYSGISNKTNVNEMIKAKENYSALEEALNQFTSVNSNQAAPFNQYVFNINIIQSERKLPSVK